MLDPGAKPLTERARLQGVSNPIRFQGQYQDPETALHYNRYRYYEPKMARYVSRDPIGMQGGMNVYSYVSNAPVMRADPLGLWDAAFANMPGVQERASLGTHMMNNGESPEAVARAMAPPPRPVATGECKASIVIAAGAGMSGSVAVNEKSGVSKWGSFQTSTVANRASASCGLKFSAEDAKPLPAALGFAFGVGIFNVEVTQISSWPDIYMGLGPGVGYEVKSPLNPSINFQ
ncbi:RHS repeat-associated core domain-containing protein [Pseudomonas oryziphila]|uniref:RHS repeat-associated core domain-containing protein n=1 Tax=Pseudomonas oryziphila TaxID=2894079 RepID=UPI001CB89ADD|nr:RHS repeat-associated core domain-containing protein [Pseudomonas oryziphila]